MTPWTSTSQAPLRGIFQVRILEWVAFPSPGDLPNPGIELRSPALQADSLLSEPPGKPRFVGAAAAAAAKSLQSCLTMCNPMDCNPPGFSGHGILQARILEWVALPSSRGSSRLKDRTRVSCIAGRFFTI